MTKPVENPQSLDGSEQEQRARRLVQIASVTIAGLVIVLVRAWLEPSPATAAILALGIGTMLLCLCLNHHGSTNVANLLLVMALTMMVAALSWRGEGFFPIHFLAKGPRCRP